MSWAAGPPGFHPPGAGDQSRWPHSRRRLRQSVTSVAQVVSLFEPSVGHTSLETSSRIDRRLDQPLGQRIRAQEEEWRRVELRSSWIRVLGFRFEASAVGY